MPWAAGSFTRSNGVNSGASTWATDAAGGTGITTTRHDVHDEDIADGVDACLTKDGANSPSAHLTWLKSQYYGGTSGGSANSQTISLSPTPGAYAAGQLFVFICGFTSTAAWTVNVNSLGAKTVVGADAISGRMIALLYDGTNLVPPDSCSALILDRVTTLASISSTTSETTLYSKSIPANLLGTKRALRLCMYGRMLNNSGSDRIPVLRVKFGSTTLITSGVNLVLNQSVLSRNYYLNIVLAANNSASAQKATADLNISSPLSSGTMNVQVYTGFTAFASGYGTATEDTTSAKTLAVTFQPDASSADLACVIENATLELL